MPIDLDHPALVEPDATGIIYRYLDLEKFEYLLRDCALFFCRSDKFSDPFEASVPKKEVDYRIIESKRLASYSNRTITDEEAEKSSYDMGNLHKRFRKSFVVNCWHINSGESDAMWRLYLKTNEGVAVQSTVSKLIDSFANFDERIYMSKVRYINYEKDIYYHEQDYPIMSYNCLSPIVHKRNAFVHEAELRIFQQIEKAVDDESYWNNEINYKGKNIQCDIIKLIDKLILPPTSDGIVYDKVKALLEKYRFNFTIEKSRLNDEPLY